MGGVRGCVLALPLHGVATGTFNWTTFAEVGFECRITAGLLLGGMLFALIMGALGGVLPARLAARKPVLEALRATRNFFLPNPPLPTPLLSSSPRSSTISTARQP